VCLRAARVSKRCLIVCGAGAPGFFTAFSRSRSRSRLVAYRNTFAIRALASRDREGVILGRFGHRLLTRAARKRRRNYETTDLAFQGVAGGLVRTRRFLTAASANAEYRGGISDPAWATLEAALGRMRSESVPPCHCRRRAKTTACNPVSSRAIAWSSKRNTPKKIGAGYPAPIGST